MKLKPIITGSTILIILCLTQSDGLILALILLTAYPQR
jgi:hypothetical protein